MAGEPPIRLVPLEDEHIARYLPFSHDPILVASMGWRPFEAGEIERFRDYAGHLTVPNMAGGHTIAFSIMCAEDNMPIGYISLKGVRDGGAGAEVGLAIMDKRYRNRGFGTEALRQAAAYAFQELELSLLELTVFPDNARAIRSYEQVGFVRTDILRDSWELPDGTLTDTWVMELYRPYDDPHHSWNRRSVSDSDTERRLQL